MKYTPFVAIAFIFGLSSCQKSADQANKFAEIKKADWLTGSWGNSSIYGNLSESWEKINDSTYYAKSYFIKGNDTLHQEAIELSQKGDIVTYSATVQGQNNDKPVPFRLTKATEKQLIFENPAHDYTKKITYTQITKDSLIAEISGMQQGKMSSERYPMKKK